MRKGYPNRARNTIAVLKCHSEWTGLVKPLVPHLSSLAYLREHSVENFEPDIYMGLIIKASYWRWPERNLAGNTIDFHVKVLGLSFSDAMSEILR